MIKMAQTRHYFFSPHVKKYMKSKNQSVSDSRWSGDSASPGPMARFMFKTQGGNFVISHIDPSRCTGCGLCFKTCSLDVFRLDTQQPTRSPCMAACPAGTDIRAYNHLLQQGRHLEALAVLKRAMPFPAITGRVCFHPCESECTRTRMDAGVNINGLEQWLGDLDLTLDPEAAAVRRSGAVAVVGSGPAGLSAAWFLALEGYPVTVFEALPEPGGMLRYGIPAYRLPDAVMAAQARLLEKIGVRFRCNTRIGDGADLNLDDLAGQGFRAVLLAPGLSLGKRLPLEGSDRPGVLTGVEFLRALRDAGAPSPAVAGQRVVVIGGGNVAIDAAISARRLGAAQVDLYCLEDEARMPAFAHNIADARAEGVGLHPGCGPQRILADDEGRVTGVAFAPCLRLLDDTGAWNPLFDAERPLTARAESVILAIGQTGDFTPFRRHVELRGAGRILADPDSLVTARPTVFAAGDAVSGPASVIEAITGGRRAARAIMRLLQGRAQPAAPEAELPVATDMPVDRLPSLPRQERSVGGASGFDETRQGFDPVQAQAESMRCLTCGSKARIAYDDDCMTCFHCELRCPAEAIDVHPFKERLPYTLYDSFGEGRNI